MRQCIDKPVDRSISGRKYNLEEQCTLPNPDGRWISLMMVDENQGELFCAMDSDVVVWKLSSRQVIFRMCGLHDLPITGMALEPQTRYLITSSADRTIKVWAYAEKQRMSLQETLLGHTRGINAVMYHADSGLLLSCR